MKISIISRPCLTANLWSSNLVKRPAIGYLFFVTHKILEKLITLKFLDIKLLIFPTHLMQFFAMLVCPPSKVVSETVKRSIWVIACPKRFQCKACSILPLIFVWSKCTLKFKSNDVRGPVILFWKSHMLLCDTHLWKSFPFPIFHQQNSDWRI